jgi:glycosyltransferase involved in cell wall biosynthesis
MSARPLVWVVTPVHNGERYLAECIESVLAQTYDNWQYLVVDNCSTDRTREIVRAYAARDSRVRLHQNSDFLAIMANWNHALRQIPSEAKYCKVVHADDTLFPECLERMADVAERNPSVALVTSYALWGDEVRHQGVPYPVEVVDGREVGRSTLLGSYYLFGSPTSLLVRAGDVRARPAFYNEENLHADTEVCFDLLKDADLGFVHQILTRTRVHAEAMTSFAVKVNTFHDAWLTIHLKYGRLYLERREYNRRLAYRLQQYAVFLAKAAVQTKFRDPPFREHHRAALGRLLRCVPSWGVAARRRKAPLPSGHPRTGGDERSRPRPKATDEDLAERE